MEIHMGFSFINSSSTIRSCLVAPLCNSLAADFEPRACAAQPPLQDTECWGKAPLSMVPYLFYSEVSCFKKGTGRFVRSSWSVEALPFLFTVLLSVENICRQDSTVIFHPFHHKRCRELCAWPCAQLGKYFDGVPGDVLFGLRDFCGRIIAIVAFRTLSSTDARWRLRL